MARSSQTTGVREELERKDGKKPAPEGRGMAGLEAESGDSVPNEFEEAPGSVCSDGSFPIDAKILAGSEAEVKRIR